MRAVGILNLGEEDYAEGYDKVGLIRNRVEIDFPPLPSSDYHWEYAFTTDNPEYYPDLVDYQKPIEVNKCADNRHVYDQCEKFSIDMMIALLYLWELFRSESYSLS